MTQETANFWQVIILAITAVIIFWYTVETYWLRRESQRQTELQLRPFVVLEAVRQIEGVGFQVKNIGNGTALNIRIGSVLVKYEGTLSEVIGFPDTVSSLSQGESILVSHREEHEKESVKITANPGIFAQRLLPYLYEGIRSLLDSDDDSSLPALPSITVEFEDIEKRRYCVREKLVLGALEIIDSGRK